MLRPAEPPLTVNATLRWDVVSRALPADATKVLEIGCGQGAVAARLARMYPGLVAVEPDQSSSLVAADRVAAAGRGTVLQGGVEQLPPGETFDLVCSFEVIEHIKDDVAELARWVGLVRPGGTLLLSTPGYQRLFSEADEMVGHFRRYEPEDLRRKMQDAGLRDVVVRHYGFPVGLALERARRFAGRRRKAALASSGTPLVDGSHEQIAERTAGSGRWLQPDARWKAAAFRLAASPFLPVQRRFPDRGTTLVAWGRTPG